MSLAASAQDRRGRVFVVVVTWILSAVVAFVLALLANKFLKEDAPSLGVGADHSAAARACVVERTTETFDDVGGLDEVKKALVRNVILPLKNPSIFFHGPLPLRPPKGVLLTGPPGTGKTMLARAIASESGANFLALTSATMESKWWGESSKLLQAAFGLARTELQPCIVFFDEIDGMGRSRSEHDQSCVYSFKTELLRNLDGVEKEAVPPAVIVIACTNCASSLDPALRRRLPYVVHVGRPNAAARRDILKKLTREERGRREKGGADVLAQVADMTEGYTGSDLAALYSDASSLRLQAANLSEMITSLSPDDKTGTALLDRMGPLTISHWRRAIESRSTQAEPLSSAGSSPSSAEALAALAKAVGKKDA